MNPTENTKNELTEQAVEGPTRTAEPEAMEVSEFARHGDPSQTAKTSKTLPRIPGRGVEWVRPSDLLTRASSHIAGRGIDFHTELARRTRVASVHGVRVAGKGIGTAGRAISTRAGKLPPASAFGRGAGPDHSSWVTRSGIGLG